ncbi:hypothetical protein A4A49_22311 [Nicotiana attenuata]|uniref:Uncharacterized protein n=1 Tax=Nicotiana attenuata TaxID=49451 RepID=A0A1J6KGR9_NICAT|nr:hypothetical protein A4A49_22311 [Nicotiana attenuata]
MSIEKNSNNLAKEDEAGYYNRFQFICLVIITIFSTCVAIIGMKMEFKQAENVLLTLSSFHLGAVIAYWLVMSHEEKLVNRSIDLALAIISLLFMLLHLMRLAYYSLLP